MWSVSIFKILAEFLPNMGKASRYSGMSISYTPECKLSFDKAEIDKHILFKKLSFK